MKTAALLLLLFALAAPVLSQVFDPAKTFQCDGTLWISRISELQFVDFDTATNTYVFTQQGSGTFPTINSLGYNPIDNFIYGNRPVADPNPGTILRADNDYRLEDLGSPSNWPYFHPSSTIPDHSGFFSGDFDPAGNYYMASGGRGVVFRIDVTTTPPVITDQWNIAYSGADFAIDPTSSNLVLYTTVRANAAGVCYAPERMDLSLCTGSSAFVAGGVGGATCDPAVTTYTDTTCDPTLDKSSGASFFDSFGNYYALHNDDASAPSGFISQWDITTTPFQLVRKFTGEVFSGGDGASCPAPFVFQKDVNPRAPQAGSVVTYTFTITSPFFFPTPDLSFTDTLSGGTEWVPGSVVVTGSATTAVVVLSQTDISVSNMELPPNSSIVVTAQATIPVSFTGTFSNQATLQGVPVFSGGPTLLSDDPVTSTADDPTVIQILYDFSDAPSSYGNAGHTVGPSTPMIGTTVDTETTRFNGFYADGDDTNNTDDETGVSFSTLQAGSTGLATVVTTHGSPAFFELWVDMVGSADFAAAGDAVTVALLATDGTRTFNVNVPGNAKTGFSYARARISDPSSGTGPTGDRVSGEVEDHQVFIACNPSPSVPCTCTLPFYNVILPEVGDLPLYAMIHVVWEQVAATPSSYPGDTEITVDLMDASTLQVIQSYGTYPIGSFDIYTPLGPHRVNLGPYVLGVRGATTGCFLGDGPVNIDLVTGNEHYAEFTP